MISKLNNITKKIVSEFNQSLFNQTSYKYYFEPIANSYFSYSSLLSITAEVITINLERADIITLTLKPSKKWKGFIPGQHLLLGLDLNGVFTERIFSISSSLQEFENEGTIKVSIQRQQNGKFTSWIHSKIKTGDIITISPAMGVFTLQNCQPKILLIAGGAGITPFRSMLYQAAENNNSTILVYYCSVKDSHLFKEELEKIANKNKKIEVHFISTKESGRCTAEQLNDLCEDLNEREIFICGPTDMIESVETQLISSGIPSTNITTEYFKAKKLDLQNLELKSGIVNVGSKEIMSDGKTVLLEVLENAALKPAYGCRIGVCRQCTCTKKSGYVYNTLTKKWSTNEKETIQACISIPSGNVEIELF